MGERYFFDNDESGHWYLVPASRRVEWAAWCTLDQDDEAAWDAPKWAKRLDGGMHGWTFSDPLPEAE